MPDSLEHPTMGLLLRLLDQLYSLEIQGALREAGFDDINPAAANVFTFLTSDGATVSELASLSHVRKQTMAQTVEQLERSGYVERRPNPKDRRSQLVFLTARGKRVPRITHKAAGPSRTLRPGQRCGRARDPPEVPTGSAHSTDYGVTLTPVGAGATFRSMRRDQ